MWVSVCSFLLLCLWFRLVIAFDEPPLFSIPLALVWCVSQCDYSVYSALFIFFAAHQHHRRPFNMIMTLTMKQLSTHRHRHCWFSCSNHLIRHFMWFDFVLLVFGCCSNLCFARMLLFLPFSWLKCFTYVNGERMRRAAAKLSTCITSAQIYRYTGHLLILKHLCTLETCVQLL